QIVTFEREGLAWLGSGTLMYLPMPAIIAAVMLLLIWLLTRKTALGLFIEAVGINLRSARNAGVSTGWVVMAVYVICGLCAANHNRQDRIQLQPQPGIVGISATDVRRD
ncbi:ABC transporter permease, partial [Pseudomonas aeruginosa]|uniref:ABC transporter permease n=1 Tax=Pseudomonas aeruginosa TaxID=287 RepID=UPI001BA70F95